VNSFRDRILTLTPNPNPNPDSQVDSFGDGVVVSLLSNFHLNNSYSVAADGSNTTTHMAVGGVEYTYAEFKALVYEALQDTSFSCNTRGLDGLSQRCYVMDEVGYP